MNSNKKVNNLKQDSIIEAVTQSVPVRDDDISIEKIYPSSPQYSEKAPINQDSVEPDTAQSPDTKSSRSGGWRSVVPTILLFLLAPVIALSITAFAFQSYQVDGESMETTLQNNDRLIVNKTPRTIARITGHPYVPHRGDIVIFNQSGLFDSPGGEKQLIKRVIGLPGDRVFIKDGFITIYNKSNPGGYNPDKSGLYKITSSNTLGDVNVTLEDNEIFVCGDNRSNSEDSRAFGPVDVKSVVGKLVLRILPINKAQSF